MATVYPQNTNWYLDPKNIPTNSRIQGFTNAPVPQAGFQAPMPAPPSGSRAAAAVNGHTYVPGDANTQGSYAEYMKRYEAEQARKAAAAAQNGSYIDAALGHAQQPRNIADQMPPGVYFPQNVQNMMGQVDPSMYEYYKNLLINARNAAMTYTPAPPVTTMPIRTNPLAQLFGPSSTGYQTPTASPGQTLGYGPRFGGRGVMPTGYQGNRLGSFLSALQRGWLG